MQLYLYLKIGKYSLQIENLRLRLFYWDESKLMMTPIKLFPKPKNKSESKPIVNTDDDDFDPIPF